MPFNNFATVILVHRQMTTPGFKESSIPTTVRPTGRGTCSYCSGWSITKEMSSGMNEVLTKSLRLFKNKNLFVHVTQGESADIHDVFSIRSCLSVEISLEKDYLTFWVILDVVLYLILCLRTMLLAWIISHSVCYYCLNDLHAVNVNVNIKRFG